MCEAAGLHGRLSATFALHDGRTTATVDDACPPLELRGPFEGANAPTFFLRNVSCGVFERDSYDVSLRATDGARAVVRSTSATKVHAMPAGCARAHTRLEAEAGSILAYVDGPLILQSDSDLRQTVEIVAQPRAIAAYAEIIVLGRIASGESLRFRRFDNEVTVRDTCDNVLYRDRFSLKPASDRRSISDASPPVFATLLIAGASLQPDKLWPGLFLHGDTYIAGYDTLPNNAGIILRAAGTRVEPITTLLGSAIASIQQPNQSCAQREPEWPTRAER